jgi:alpha,alpha-trehalose phosphorylase
MRRGEPRFAPRLPTRWSRCAFKLRIGDAQVQVELDRAGTRYRLLAGDALALRHGDVPVHLSRGTPLASFAPGIAAPLEVGALA